MRRLDSTEQYNAEKVEETYKSTAWVHLGDGTTFIGTAIILDGQDHVQYDHLHFPGSPPETQCVLYCTYSSGGTTTAPAMNRIGLKPSLLYLRHVRAVDHTLKRQRSGTGREGYHNLCSSITL